MWDTLTVLLSSESERLSCLCSSLNWSLPELGENPWYYLFHSCKVWWFFCNCSEAIILYLQGQGSKTWKYSEKDRGQVWNLGSVAASDLFFSFLFSPLIGKCDTSYWSNVTFNKADEKRNETGTFPFSPFCSQSAVEAQPIRTQYYFCWPIRGQETRQKGEEGKGEYMGCKLGGARNIFILRIRGS